MAEHGDIDFSSPDLLKIKDSLKRISFVQNAFVREVKDNTDEVKEEEKANKAYFSDSWEDEAKQKRVAKGLPVSDVARFSSIVDTISGNERQNRTDVLVHPFERNDQKIADFANNYLKYRDRKESQWHTNSLVYVDCIVSPRAHFEFYLEKQLLRLRVILLHPQ